MSRPLRLEYPGAVYHVMARGNEQREIFRDDSDRELYLRLIERYQKSFGFRVYAYCLMTNHVHLAVETAETPLSRIVLALHGCYAQAFNRRHERIGHLFQGRYKALLVQKTSYLLALVRYIHENPVRAGMVTESRDYKWSSDRLYRGRRTLPWVDVDGVLAILGTDRASAVRQYNAFMAREPSRPYETLPIRGSVVKGDEQFARVAFENAGKSHRPVAFTVDQIAEVVAARCGLGRDALRNPIRRQDVARARAMVAYIAWKHAKIAHSATAEFFRRDSSTMVRDVSRIEAQLGSNARLRKALAAILERLGSNA